MIFRIGTASASLQKFYTRIACLLLHLRCIIPASKREYPMRREMKMVRAFPLLLCVLALLCAPAIAQNSGVCTNSGDMDQATRTAVESAALQIFHQAQNGDYAGLRANSIPAVASNFGGIESAVGDNQANFKGAQASVRSEYLLDANNTSGSGRTEFYCGVFNSPDRVGFGINNLPRGTYAIAIMDVKGGKSPITLSTILQNAGGWRLAGFYARPTQLAGHDGDWYMQQARAYKTKGQNHNAFFYYLEAWDLLAPVNFMSTTKLDTISDELNAVRPPDLPAPGKPVDLLANGKTYHLTQLFPTPVGDALDIVVKYQVPSIADQSAAYQDNVNVMKGLLSKYPELRDAFAAVVARAVEPGGNDYGTLLAMKDVK